MFTEGQFLLGTFASNCSSGMSVTKIPERWVNSWENNLKLAKLLDEAGIDFMLPIARVSGFLIFHFNRSCLKCNRAMRALRQMFPILLIPMLFSGPTADIILSSGLAMEERPTSTKTCWRR